MTVRFIMTENNKEMMDNRLTLFIVRTILFLSVQLLWHKASAQFPSQNYVMSELQLDRVGSRRVSTTKVYDCWGWPVMEVTTGLGSSGRNVYTLQEYNSRGEVEKSWLPVAGSRQVQDISVSDIACLSFLTYSDSKAYTYSAYDALPANKYSSFNFIDGSNEQVEYEYNGVGALTKDLNRGMTVSYDNLNNPRLIDFKGGNSITYNYLSDGTLLSKHYGSQFGSGNKARSFAESKNVYTDSDMSDRTIADTLVHKSDFSGSDMMWDGPADVFVVGETEYSGNIIYSNGNIDKVLFPGGYCTFSKAKSDEPIFHYYTQDHLGNNRIVMNEDGTVEQITHYYPFGGTFNDAGLNAGLQHYKYNGKELDRIGGLNTYDYGARQYFSALPVWDRIDPKCEEDYGISPYAYCRNNPMKFIDKKGEKIKVPYIGQRETIVGYINQYTSNEFIVSPDGFLSLNKMSEPNKDKSQTYANRLIDAINADNTINIYIFDTYETEYGTKQISDKGEGVTIRKDDYNIDVRITGKEHNVINEKGEIMKQSAADILMHELVGHAIPRIAPSRIDTGNAIKNENIIRKELNVEEREEDEAHMQ